ncbi:MAG: helix-turn-helix domain-containing protein, partial [Campylobacteraceae bacterium]|nr:helix-turn-helix domain-containing protein [Campylobacteraceae bacterium]
MRKLTVADAADELGITKEAVYNRIRRGSLKSVQENNERYILLENEPAKPSLSVKNANTSKKIVVPDERYINLLISQIEELKATNSELNKDKDRLIKEKEQLLIEQRVALETIYKERDEQLKAILTLA